MSDENFFSGIQPSDAFLHPVVRYLCCTYMIAWILFYAL